VAYVDLDTTFAGFQKGTVDATWLLEHPPTESSSKQATETLAPTMASEEVHVGLESIHGGCGEGPQSPLHGGWDDSPGMSFQSAGEIGVSDVSVGISGLSPEGKPDGATVSMRLELFPNQQDIADKWAEELRCPSPRNPTPTPNPNPN